MDPKHVRLSPNDPNSFSNPEQVRAKNLDIFWNVDFARKVIDGKVSYDLEVTDQSVQNIVFDTSGLVIKSASSNGNQLDFKLGDSVLSFGKPLSINIADLVSSKPLNQSSIKIQIDYETAAECNALQWLDKEQTAGKTHPYVFSQCEAIYARSLLPCQDTPYTKASYTAEVSVPKGQQALMSAVILEESVQKGDLITFKFLQKIPIPSYLIAIAVGNLKSKRIGPRSTVWTEQEHLEASAYEFAETEEMLQTAEKLMGEYVWGIYDLLILPPSFPFGGMENPCLTFVTPTLLAGDRSLANVIAHEISHSWTGNLVTNKNFEHFWLNEGFTVFAERKILGAMKGESYRQFASIGGWKELKDCIDTMKSDNPLTQLVPDLTGIDPDDSFSKVPYEKGFAFLYYLEQLVGGPSVFEPFFKTYIQTNRFKSIDTDTFKSQFLDYFTKTGSSTLIQDIAWDSWLFTPGMPIVKNVYDTTMTDACSKLKNRWAEWNSEEPCPFSKKDLTPLISAQVEEFLGDVLDAPVPFGLRKVKAMEEAYDFNAVKNAEIRFRWLRLCIRSKWPEQVTRTLDFVTEQGRMKYVRPLYRELYAWEEVREQTIEHFKKTRSGMMHVCATMVAKDLHL